MISAVFGPFNVMFEATRFKTIIYFLVSSANELYILCKVEVVKPASHKKYSIQRVHLLLAQLIVLFPFNIPKLYFCSSFIRNHILIKLKIYTKLPLLAFLKRLVEWFCFEVAATRYSHPFLRCMPLNAGGDNVQCPQKENPNEIQSLLTRYLVWQQLSRNYELAAFLPCSQGFTLRDSGVDVNTDSRTFEAPLKNLESCINKSAGRFFFAILN